MIEGLPFLKKSPLLVCAPMVDQSQLPFRMLVRRYSTNLCYTPMIHSKLLTSTKNYKEMHFSTCEEDRPLVAQLCGNDVETMIKAGKILQDQVDAIDINLGCPQGIARRGHYGSFLLGEPQLIYNIVKGMSESLKVPVFCKIRVLPSEQKTFHLVDRIVEAGCKLLTVHGRTKEMNKDTVGECDWQIIRKIKERVNIPVVANGGIYRYQDVLKCINFTNVDGVMSSQALLENPTLFSNSEELPDLDQIALEYLECAEKYKGADSGCIRAHLFKFLFAGLKEHVDLRDRMVKALSIEEFRQIVLQLKERRKDIARKDKFGWYLRYWKDGQKYQKGIRGEKKKEPQIQEKQNQQQKLQKKQQIQIGK